MNNFVHNYLHNLIEIGLEVLVVVVVVAGKAKVGKVLNILLVLHVV